MKTTALLLALALGASTPLLHAQDTPPAAPPAGSAACQCPAPRAFQVHVLPPRAGEVLQLTADQQKQVSALEAATQAQLEKILTPAQLAQLKQMHPPRPPRGPGRPGGPGPMRGMGGPDGMPPQPPPPAE